MWNSGAGNRGAWMSRQAKTLSSIIESDRFAWLDAIAEPVQASVQKIFGASDTTVRIKSLLNGTPLRHRLHPMLVITPLGAWTMAAIFDALDSASDQPSSPYAAAADTAIGVGVVTSSAAALSGIADWSDLWSQPRRVGIAHALSNVTALACYGTSLALRSSDHRGPAKMFSTLGLGALVLGGALGGDLVYNLGSNVRFALYPKPPNEERDVLASDELAEQHRVVVEVDRVPVMLYRADGHVYAVEDWCPHAGGPLSEGPIHDCVVTCPWHGSEFDVRDGAPLVGPAANPLRTFDVREVDGRILIRPSYEGLDWPPPPEGPRANPEHVAL